MSCNDTLDSCKVETISVSIMTSDIFIKSEISGKHVVAELYCLAFSFSLWPKKKKVYSAFGYRQNSFKLILSS